MTANVVEVTVGRIGRPHGVAGMVTIEVRTDDPEHRFAPGAVLRTVPAITAFPTLTVGVAREHSGRLLLHFEGVTDRTAAEALRGLLLVVDVDPAELPDGDGEFYDRQLVGLTAEHVDGSRLGEVTEVVHVPGQDLLVVARGKDRSDLLVPFVADIVTDVDLAARRVLINPPEGLLDLADDQS